MSKPIFGFHYDIARGTYLKHDIFCKAIRLAAQSGYTHFFPYMENMIRLPSMVRACPTCAYTAQDWMSFEAVAKEVRIELVPHFNVIGHTELIGPAYPELCGEVNDRKLKDIDISRPQGRQWMLSCLDEFCEFSHSEYFLIGGDEWQPPRSLLAKSDFDVTRTWADQVNAAVELLVRRGRTPIVWHDMLIHYPAACEMLSRKAVIAFWFYDHDSDYAALSMFKALGFKTLMSTAVFDGAMPTLGRRSVAALRCAAVAASKHHCDGMIVTSWAGCRWELESFNIPFAAKVIKGQEPPGDIVDAVSLLGAWLKLPEDSLLARKWKSRIEALLDRPTWSIASDMRRVIQAMIRGDRADDEASYVQYHHLQGHGYENRRKPRIQPVWRIGEAEKFVPISSFGLKVVSDQERGDELRFSNENESFVVYPKFGGSLQSWVWEGHNVISDTLENFLEHDMLPGGYRSYGTVGGFRPIWGMGTHSNPCILWQYPWDWRIVEQSPAKVVVDLTLELPHGSFVMTITIQRGRSGFGYEARCVNKLEHAFGGFNFNLPLPLGLDDLTVMKLTWADQSKQCEMTLAGVGQSAFWIPARGPLTLDRGVWSLQINASPTQTAGYFTDWNAGFITPDLHAVYQPLTVGQETRTCWRFEPLLQTQSQNGNSR